MHCLRTLLCVLPVLATAISAQEKTDQAPPAQDNPMAPASEQKVFDKILGIWEGSGSWRPSGDAPEAKWTGTSTARKVLNGQFVQEDVVIDLGSAVPGMMRMRNFYGWDKENKRYMIYGFNNMGEVFSHPIHWSGNTMISSASLSREGKWTTEHWSTTYAKDSYTMVGNQIVDGDKPFVHVRGGFKRTTAVPAAFRDAKTIAFAPASKEMGRLNKMIGTYRIDGWMIPMAGMEKQEIGAVEVFTPMFDGTVLTTNLKGDDSPMGSYEAIAAMAWNATRNCYDQLWLSNMGEGMCEPARFVDGKLISTYHGLQYGATVATRSLATFDDNGRLVSSDAHILSGTADPAHCFHVTYKFQGNKK